MSSATLYVSRADYIRITLTNFKLSAVKIRPEAVNTTNVYKASHTPVFNIELMLVNFTLACMYTFTPDYKLVLMGYISAGAGGKA